MMTKVPGLLDPCERNNPSGIGRRSLLWLVCLWGLLAWSTPALATPKAFHAKLTQTRAASARLGAQLKALRRDLRGASLSLLVPLQVTHTLGQIDDLLKLMKETIAPLQALPQVGIVVSSTAGVLVVLRKIVHPLRTETGQIVKPLQALGQSLMRFEKRLQAHQRSLHKSLGQYSRATKAWRPCLRKTKGKRTKALRFANTSIPRLVLIHSSLKTTNGALRPLSAALRKSHALAKAMMPALKGMQQIDKNLKKVKVVILKLQQLLKKRIEVPYPVKIRQPFEIKIKEKVKVKLKVKVKKWYKPWKWKWVFKTKIKWKEIVKVKKKWKNVVKMKKVGLTVEQILKGAKVNVSVANGKLKELAMKALAPLLNQLKAVLPKRPKITSLPGLSSIKGILLKHAKATLSAPRLLKQYGLHHKKLWAAEKAMQKQWGKRPKCK